jgi:hypothetical protein
MAKTSRRKGERLHCTSGLQERKNTARVPHRQCQEEINPRRFTSAPSPPSAQQTAMRSSSGEGSDADQHPRRRTWRERTPEPTNWRERTPETAKFQNPTGTGREFSGSNQSARRTGLRFRTGLTYYLFQAQPDPPRPGRACLTLLLSGPPPA